MDGMSGSYGQKRIRIVKIGVDLRDVSGEGFPYPLCSFTLMLDVVGETLISSLCPWTQSFARVVV